MINLALASILLPAIGAALIALLPRSFAKRTGQVFAGLATAVLLVLAYQFSQGGKVAIEYAMITYGDVEILGFAVDTVSVLVACAVVGIGFLISIYSGGYLDAGNREHPDIVRRRYFAFLSLFIGAMAGLVFSSTVIGQLVFFEISGVCSWALIGYYEKPKSLYSAAKALIITHIASLGLYVAASLLFLETHTFSLSAIAGMSDGLKTVFLLAVLFAAWGKSAQLPFHMWLPDAMEAPTPVSAYLHAASMVKVGVYIFARALMSSHGAPEIVGYVCTIMATVTLVYGFFMYLPQADMKRLLAYSTITQLAYMFLGLGLSVFGSQMAFNGAIAHLFNHAFAKTLFFLVAGALSYTTGTRLLPLLRGILSKSPLLGIAFVVAALAIAGVPPFNGFFSKFEIFAGGFEVAQQHPVLMVLLVIALLESIGSFAWLLKWVGWSVPGRPSEAVAAAAPVPLSMQIVLVTLIIMAVCSSFIAATWLG
ncbi:MULTISPECIES: hydrogenase 4 subunit D [Rhodopseudomonas]|uniref:Hydrogenase 4 subunit D n=1 Tax=Rhodopseudomonas palustris TaxID=1076 RepID=A0A0D7EUQ3_RHOPL|nr:MULTISPECIES: hydrogenase 4 subunit D [Rhodopseudomonas]KIZ43172.1 hydrogenase 4 subunit D [Rhodopseudomonas palustris]MDF3811861.1 hydrogenase 4 subunit D [Rhodopseudomonas sp. BAL398]WOK19741.1 hydrogenase 4 subunit D [Rhodopseudomonas sp. BAL398]